MKIKENLAYCRRKRKLSFRELGELTNINYATLYYIESGKTPNPQILVIVTLAQFFNISLDEFVNVDLKCKNRIEDKANDT
ncbi:helix-turn-helix domain-containing protein [[Clostridium] innocuum]|uniref:helix-turn-helix domain-containing protein n=1 Tax=Clostridium innocuum TaxID=1522 RepID=UPI0021484D5D|nr:helix-turn-helix domain-containing protein [[Clostridium] innocuum]